MERTLILDAIKKVGEKVLLAGYVATRRDHGKLVFIDLLDRSGIIQVVGGEELSSFRPQDVVEIEGLVQKRPEKMINDKIPTGKVEVSSEKVNVLSKAQELPFDMGTETLNLELPTLLDWRGLTLRHPKVKAIFKVQEVVIDSFREALKKKDFFEFQSPTIIPAVPEGGSEVFKVDYFGNDAFLSQSPQLYKSLLVGAFERVFAVNKVFRAEPSVTTTHLTEFVSLDAEMGFINSWLDVKDMAEYTIKFILENVRKKCQKELEMFGVTIPQVSDRIPTLKMREAQEIIYKLTGRDCRKEKDLAPEDEREICAWAKKEHNSDLVFISHYMTKFRPFYTYPDDDDPEFNQGFDLLGRGREWLTGGRRINDYKTLMEHTKKWKVDSKKIELYLQAFRFGMPPLGGFAFGAERITMFILALGNIREASLFPRDMERVDIRFSKQGRLDNGSGNDVYEEILSLLDKNGIVYQKYEHEPVFTSKDAARVRGTDIHQGAKALVMQADKDFILFVLPADLSVDLENLESKLGAKKLSLVSKESVKAKTGLAVGSVPPFGSLMGLKTYVDLRLADNYEIAFNAGRHDRSVKMGYSDFLKMEKPEVIQIK